MNNPISVKGHSDSKDAVVGIEKRPLKLIFKYPILYQLYFSWETSIIFCDVIPLNLIFIIVLLKGSNIVWRLFYWNPGKHEIDGSPESLDRWKKFSIRLFSFVAVATHWSFIIVIQRNGSTNSVIMLITAPVLRTCESWKSNFRSHSKPIR